MQKILLKGVVLFIFIDIKYLTKVEGFCLFLFLFYVVYLLMINIKSSIVYLFIIDIKINIAYLLMIEKNQ